MTRRPIGYYVHHQGAGHAARARLIANALDRPCTLMGTFAAATFQADVGAGSVLDLPDDRIGEGFDGHDHAASRPLAFHYAPLGIAGVRARMAAIAAWVAVADPVLMIVDVSVEVALFARLLSVPTLVVRLPGDRTDPPHLEAFRSAERLLAFFPAGLDSAGNPGWVRAKTEHIGFLTVDPTNPAAAGDGAIVVVYGRGGAGGSGPDLAAAARAVPQRPWHVVGPVTGAEGVAPPNLHLHGWVDDIGAHLDRAALVIGAGGDGLVARVVAGAKRFVCIPEPRAFDEQAATARALHAHGAALHCSGWPSPSAWPGVVAAGLALDPARIASLGRGDAVGRAARLIAGIADGLDARRDGSGAAAVL